MALSTTLPEVTSTTKGPSRKQNMQDSPPVYDLICVGFGTTALAFAAALADDGSIAPKKVLFIERQRCFSWRQEHVLPTATVGTSFLRDLITTQNPRSKFTLLNFLHATNRLVQFTNASQLRPSRLLMGTYFRWVAEQIQELGWVSYGHEALRITPVQSGNARKNVTGWSVDIRDVQSGAQSAVQARRVVIAAGALPQIPSALASPTVAPLIVHSSDCSGLIENLDDQSKSLDIAIVGENQEAAEIFEHLYTVRGQHRATMFIADSALRPEDRTPFTSQAFDNPALASDAALPPELRQRIFNNLSESRVATHTIESLYEKQYEQQVAQPDASKRRFRVQPHSEIVGAEREHDRARLVVKDTRTGDVRPSDWGFDIVIVASGYEFKSPAAILGPVKGLLDGKEPKVDWEYRISLRRGVVSSGCGLWLLGSLQDHKSRTDDFVSMAESAKRATRSVIGEMGKDDIQEQQVEKVAML